jgi:hypothetical protein
MGRSLVWAVVGAAEQESCQIAPDVPLTLTTAALSICVVSPVQSCPNSTGPLVMVMVNAEDGANESVTSSVSGVA